VSGGAAYAAGKVGAASAANKAAGKVAGKAVGPAVKQVAARLAAPAATTGATAAALGLPAVGSAGALGLGSAGAYYGLGKAIEKSMSKEDHEKFDRAAKDNPRMRHEMGKSKPKAKFKRRHN
jgi:hypothetical protein